MPPWFLSRGNQAFPPTEGPGLLPATCTPFPSSPLLPLAVSESSGGEQTCLAGCWVPSPCPLPAPPSSAPLWGAAPHHSPTAQGSSSSHPRALGEDGAFPTAGHCRHEISPSNEAEIQAGRRLRGVASNANLLQRGFSACLRKGRDALAEASACEISRGGLGDPPFGCSIQPLPSEHARGNLSEAPAACSPQQGMVDRAVAAP